MFRALAMNLIVDPQCESSDRQLLEHYLARRDDAAFATLVARHSGTVWGVCRRMLDNEQDVEDAFQAVFLTLAQNAASIRKQEAVGGWLYGVAYRTALKARLAAARRRNHERKLEPTNSEEPPWSAEACRDLQRILDAEVARLDEKYRTPFILSCLEGKSKAEAARELGWKEGTVSGRLAQARKLLQCRLAQRGIRLSAILTALALLQQTAVAAAPEALLHGTIHAALAPAGGQIAATAFSPGVLALVESTPPTLLAFKSKLAILFMPLVLLVAGAGLVANHFSAVNDSQPEAPGEAIKFRTPPVPVIRSIDERVFAAAFSPDGATLVTGGGLRDLPGQIKIWNVPGGDEQTKIRGIAGVRSIAFLPDGKSFLTGDFEGNIKMRDARTGAEQQTVKAHANGVNCLALAPDGMSFASAGLDQTVKVWDVANLKYRKTLTGHAGLVYTVAYFRHGKAIVSGSEDGTAKIWDLGTGKNRFTLRGHKLGVEAVAIAPDDKTVATTGWDGTIKFWDADTGMETGEIKGDGRSLFALAFTRDGAGLVSTGGDGIVRWWDAKKRSLTQVLGKHQGATFSLAFSKEDQYLASGSLDNTAKIFSVKDMKELATLKAYDLRPINGLAYSHDGQRAAVASDDNLVRIYNLATGELDTVKTSHAGAVKCVAYSRDGTWFASGSADSTISLLHLGSSKLQVLKGHTSAVNSLSFSADGTKLASGGDDSVVKIWNTQAASESQAFAGHKAPVSSVAFAPDGNVLASGSLDNTLRLWRMDKQSEPITLKAHPGTIRAVAFSSEHLASAGEDGVKLWRIEAGIPADLEPHELPGHKGGTVALVFAPNGRTLVSSGRDRNLAVWDATNGELLQTLSGHKSIPTALAMHPQGNDVISGGLDTLLFRWPNVKSAPDVGPGETVKQPKNKKPNVPDSNLQGKVELLEDGIEFFIDNLDNNGGRDGSVAMRNDRSFYSGKTSLSVSPFQRYKTNLPGWNYQIAENPRPGEFRYVRFAWKRSEGAGILLSFFTPPKKWEGYYAGKLSHVIKQPRIRIADDPPRKWEVVTRDVFKDFGPIRITGISFSPMEGPGEASFDHFYLARSIEDLDRVAENVAKAPAPSGTPNDAVEEPSPARAWIMPVAIIGASLVLLIAGVLAVLVIRRHARPVNKAEQDAMVSFPCKHCGKKLKAKSTWSGKSVKCPSCSKSSTIPPTNVPS